MKETDICSSANIVRNLAAIGNVYVRTSEDDSGEEQQLEGVIMSEMAHDTEIMKRVKGRHYRKPEQE